MGLGRALAVGLIGLTGHLVEVEADVAAGLPAFTLVGLPDAALVEARDRVRAATANAGCPLPARRITVNLSPAALPKAGTAFDLAVAAALLAASGQVDPGSVAAHVHLGELGLDGRVQPVRGVLPAVLAAVRAGRRRVVVPAGNAIEAALVPDAEITPVRTLADVVALHRGIPAARAAARRLPPGSLQGDPDPDRADTPGEQAPVRTASVGAGGSIGSVGTAPLGSPRTSQEGLPETGSVGSPGTGPVGSARTALAGGSPGTGSTPATPSPVAGQESGRATAAEPDLADVVGQRQARYALEVAAAGGHHLLLVGPPGAGKTMLAARLPGLLPDLDDDEALEVTAVHSIAGTLDARQGLLRRPPFEDPHHTATVTALVGGGSGLPRPGAASRAHRGVLFLDEAAEFQPKALDALRQPLEYGELVIHRAQGTARFPARFQLVLATNPCPCGRAVGKGDECSCTSVARRRYLGRLSGPLLDRVDLQVEVLAVSRADLASAVPPESTAAVAARVRQARGAQRTRLAGYGWSCNGQVPGWWLRGTLRLPGSVTLDLDRALDRGQLSIRGYDRVLRASWTVADLRGAVRPDRDDVGRALLLRHRGAVAA